MKICNYCGQIEGIKEYDNALWDAYSRLPEYISRSQIEPFVYTGNDLEEMGYYDDEDTHDAVMHAMEKNMVERGLCGGCGRPNLEGINTDDLLSEEDARDLHDMYAEMAAERRAGC